METFVSLKGFQSHLAVRINTNVFPWSNVCLNFISTGQDSINCSLKTVAYLRGEILSRKMYTC